MKSRKAAVFIAAGAVILSLGGVFAVKTVFAAEEKIAVTDKNSGTVLHALAEAEVMNTYKKDVYGDSGCTVVLPTGYVPSDSIKGMYVAEHHPLDSSNIYYAVAEKVDGEALEEAVTSGWYKDRTEENFKETYGQAAVLSDYRLTKTQIDGCPAYRIELSCDVEDMKMEQLIYMIAADKVYTITYSQSADDERMEEFKQSAETIRMVFQ